MANLVQNLRLQPGRALPELSSLKLHVPVEHHLERRPFGQYEIRTSGKQNGRQSGCRSGGSADARAHPGVTRGASGDAADSGSAGGSLGDSPGITTFVAFAANLALFAIELARFRVGAAHSGPKIP